MNEGRNEQTKEGTNERTNKRKNEQTKEGTNERTNKGGSTHVDRKKEFLRDYQESG